MSHRYCSPSILSERHHRPTFASSSLVKIMWNSRGKTEYNIGAREALPCEKASQTCKLYSYTPNPRYWPRRAFVSSGAREFPNGPQCK